MLASGIDGSSAMMDDNETGACKGVLSHNQEKDPRA
jgi:hypothetical protein